MKSKQALFARRARRRRFKLKQQSGNGRLRLSVFRSNRQTYAQIVDDRRGMTLVSASTLEKTGAGKTQASSTKSVAAASEVGRRLAERAKEKGVSTVVFDCGGYRYHGRVKALAEAARDAGMNF